MIQSKIFLKNQHKRYFIYPEGTFIFLALPLCLSLNLKPSGSTFNFCLLIGDLKTNIADLKKKIWSSKPKPLESFLTCTETKCNFEWRYSPVLVHGRIKSEWHGARLKFWWEFGLGLWGVGYVWKWFIWSFFTCFQGSLNSYLSKTVITWSDAVRLSKSLAEGLAHLHSDLYSDGVCQCTVLYVNVVNTLK